jgi:hypothetical protein
LARVLPSCEPCELDDEDDNDEVVMMAVVVVERGNEREELSGGLRFR